MSFTKLNNDVSNPFQDPSSSSETIFDQSSSNDNPEHLNTSLRNGDSEHLSLSNGDLGSSENLSLSNGDLGSSENLPLPSQRHQSTAPHASTSSKKKISNKNLSLHFDDNVKPTGDHLEHKHSSDSDFDDENNDPVRFGSSSSASTYVDKDHPFLKNNNDHDDDDDDDDTQGHQVPFTDHYGHRYDHVDFDSKRYTSKLQFKGTRLVYFTSAFVSLFVSLFGYEQGVCSGILTYVTFRSYFHDPSPTQIGLVISILEIGAMISSLLVAKISDRFGRKRTILLGTFIFMIGGTLQSFATNLFIFSVGRVLSGLGVGVLSTMVPSYQCEISPSEDRGKLVCGEFSGNIAGYCLSVWVDYFCYFIQDIGDARTNPHTFAANLSWRLPLFIQVLIAVVLFLGGFFIVESPRWLLDVDMDQQGFNVLSLLYDSYPSDDKPRQEFFQIKNNILQERITTPKAERSWKHMFRHHMTRVLVACSALTFAQFNGINIISYYAPMVFEQAGFENSKALLMTGVNALVYLISTISPWFLVDKWGRKPILISGGCSMAVCLGLIGLFMYLNRSYTPSMVALLVIIYNAGFGYSWGPLGFLIPPEILPGSIRSKGVSLAVACNWMGNYIVGQLTPILQDRIGWVMYMFPCVSCVLSVLVVITFYPETKGVELEDMDRLFDEFYHSSSSSPLTKLGGYKIMNLQNSPGQQQSQQQSQHDDSLELDEFDYEVGLIGEERNKRTTL